VIAAQVAARRDHRARGAHLATGVQLERARIEARAPRVGADGEADRDRTGLRRCERVRPRDTARGDAERPPGPAGLEVDLADRAIASAVGPLVAAGARGPCPPRFERKDPEPSPGP
jgi:hypothetical protein